MLSFSHPVANMLPNVLQQTLLGSEVLCPWLTRIAFLGSSLAFSSAGLTVYGATGFVHFILS